MTWCLVGSEMCIRDSAISLESAPFKHISRILICRRKTGSSIYLTILRLYGHARIGTCRKTRLIVVRRPLCPTRFRSSTVMLLRSRPLSFKVSHGMSKSAACSQYPPLISGYCELAVVEIAIPLQADKGLLLHENPIWNPPPPSRSSEFGQY